jgi:hypothetical protein
MGLLQNSNEATDILIHVGINMEQVVTWLTANKSLAIIFMLIAIVVFLLSLTRTVKIISSSNRSVSIGGDNNGPIYTGDINQNTDSRGLLPTLANIATIITLVVSIAALYIAYLSLWNNR